jgi:DNA-binding transcriptional MerR regulator
MTWRRLDVDVTLCACFGATAEAWSGDRQNHLGWSGVTEELHTIGQMCAAFGVTPRALRFYETRELLAPIRDGQRRLYTRRCRARLKLILQGKRFGISLEDIRQLLALYDIGDQQATQIARTYRLGVERLQALETQRDELDTAIAALREQMKSAEAVLAERGVSAAAE